MSISPAVMVRDQQHLCTRFERVQFITDKPVDSSESSRSSDSTDPANPAVVHCPLTVELFLSLAAHAEASQQPNVGNALIEIAGRMDQLPTRANPFKPEERSSVDGFDRWESGLVAFARGLARERVVREQANG